MKHNLKKIVIIFVITFLFSITAYSLAEKAVITGWDHDDAWIVALEGYRIQENVPEEDYSSPEWQTVKYKLIVSFLTGEYKGKTYPVTVEHLKNSRLSLVKGCKYILSVDRFEDGHDMFSISDGFRFPIVMAFLAGLAALLCIAAGMSGTRALLGLFLSLFLLAKWTIPMILAGYPPVPVAVASSAGVSALTVMLVIKNFRYWPAAFIGATGGALSASIIGWIAISLWQLTGIAAEGGNLLASSFPEINMPGILLASVIIGAIGAVLDVAISITSAMGELYEYDNEISARRLMKTGMNVGKDILGSMINTLILAYFGSSLILSLLIADSDPIFWSVLNDPMIAAEILRGIAGTAGLLLTVPVTAFAGSLMVIRFGKFNK